MRTTHGMYRTAEYKAWKSMRQRCTKNPRNKNYAGYAGRGITVSPIFERFEPFFAELGPCPKDYTLDRIDNDRGYEPGNVRWASKWTQARNKSTSRHLTHADKTQTLREWSEETGIAVGTIWLRLHLGWTIERALTEPVWTPPEAMKKARDVRWRS